MCIFLSHLTFRPGLHIASLFSEYRRTRTLRSSDGLLFTIPFCQLSSGNRAFSINAPRVWNNLTHDCRASSSIACFKRNLRTELFNVAYSGLVPALAPLICLRYTALYKFAFDLSWPLPLMRRSVCNGCFLFERAQPLCAIETIRCFFRHQKLHSMLTYAHCLNWVGTRGNAVSFLKGGTFWPYKNWTLTAATSVTFFRETRQYFSKCQVF